MSVAEPHNSRTDKLVYYWDEIHEANADSFGQKCARLAIAKREGIPVPAFFAISAEGVRLILENGGIPHSLKAEIKHNRLLLEQETGHSFIDPENPLITAVRSGDPFSMAGSMFSYPNVGINEKTLPALIAHYGERPAILHMYLDALVDHALKVENLDREKLSDILEGMRLNPSEVSDLEGLIVQAKQKPFSFPHNAIRQIYDAIQAVASSWVNFATSAFREEMEVEKDLFPSIFVQQMVFGNLENSAFLAFCTHNAISGAPTLCGDFAPGTEGRKMMRGIGPVRQAIDNLEIYFPDVYNQLQQHVSRIERLFRRPQDIEAVIENNRLYFVQIADAHLSPAARRRIVNEFRGLLILQPYEHIPPIPGVQRTRVVKTYKLRPDVGLDAVAQGKSVYPGAVEGHLALCVDDAIRLGIRRWQKVVLLLREPDERVLPMLLKRQIEGFAATYASTHDAAAAMLSYVPAVMSINAQTEGNNYLLCHDGEKIAAGNRVILDGTAGRILRAPPSSDVLIEDRPILLTPHEVSGHEIEQATRSKYGHLSYEELLNEHARYVREIEKITGRRMFSFKPQDKEQVIEYAKLELITHFIHIMIFERAKESGIPIHELQLDVAVADGSLDRVPGLEHKKIALERDGENIIFILASEVAYEDQIIESAAYSDSEISALMRILKRKQVPASLYVKQTKLSRHTQSVSTKCLEFPAEYLEDIITHLRLIETPDR